MVEAVLTPAHAHPLESLLDQPLAGAFDDAAADGQPQLFEFGVIDVVAMFVQIIVQVGQGLMSRGWQSVQGQGGLDVLQHFVGLASAQLSASGGEPVPRPLGTPVQPGLRALPQVLSGVIEVQDTERRHVTTQPELAPKPCPKCGSRLSVLVSNGRRRNTKMKLRHWSSVWKRRCLLSQRQGRRLIRGSDRNIDDARRCQSRASHYT